jgi:hypothetical protein
MRKRMNGTATRSRGVLTLSDWVYIVTVGVLTHGVVLLTDYVLWDGWWYAADLGRPDGTTVMSRLLHEVGRPIDIIFYRPMQMLGGNSIAWAKWFGTASWICAAVCMREVLRRIAFLPATTATALAVLVVALPIFDLLGELALWMNTACVLLFWLAWVLLSRLQGLAGVRAIAVRLAALGLFFISFDLNSNLVMFYAVAVVIAGLRLPDLRFQTLLARLPRIAIRYADFLVLPILFWIWKTLFTPTSGFYATGYNQPSLAPDRLSNGYTGLVVHFVVPGLLELFSSSNRVLAALIVAGIAAAVSQRVAATQSDLDVPRGRGPRLVLWGLFLLLAAAFPYIAVGQQLASEGWLSRNCILCPLPVAMIACGLLMAANEWWLQPFPRAWLSGVAGLAVLGAGGCMTNYLSYQALGAKQLSIRIGLSAAINETNAVVVQLRDYTPVPGTIPYYPPIIWTFIGHNAEGLPKAFVFETATFAPDVIKPGSEGFPERIVPHVTVRSETLEQAITDTTMPYALEGVPRRGAQILVTAEPGYVGMRPSDLGLRYLLLSWLDTERLPEFVRGFTKTSTYPLPPVE